MIGSNKSYWLSTLVLTMLFILLLIYQDVLCPASVHFEVFNIR